MSVYNQVMQINSVYLRAVRQLDSSVARLCNEHISSSFQLVEVWLLPENAAAITPQFLEKATANSIGNLLMMIGDKAYLDPLRYKLIDRFLPRLPVFESYWHYSILGVQDGHVISIVFGSQNAMDEMYNHGLRERLTAPS